MLDCMKVACRRVLDDMAYFMSKCCIGLFENFKKIDGMLVLLWST